MKTRTALALLACCLMTANVHAAEETIYFREGGGGSYTDVTFDDTFVDNYYPSDTEGTNANVNVWPGAHRLYGLMAIKDLFTELPRTSGGQDIDIKSAKLYLTRYNSGGSGTVVSIYPITTDWLPDSAGSNENDCCWTYSEKSSSTGWASGGFSTSDYDGTVCSTGNWVSNYDEQCELDVTEVISAIYEDGTNYGWVIDASGNISFRSSEQGTASKRPSLEITYEYIGTTFTLTVNSGSGDGTYAESTVVDITADTAPSGQDFDKWTGDTSGIADTSDPTTTITMPASNAEITATYADKTWTLTVHSGSGGGSYVVGTVVDIDADTAPSGTQFDKWVGDTAGIASLTSASTTLTMPYAAAEITATYVSVTYTLTVNSGTGDGSYTSGTVVDIAADAAPSGKAFEEWTGDVGGIADVNDPTTTITMPASDAEVTAAYADLHTLTVNSGSGDGGYKEGQAADISADEAPSGKFFDAWIGDTGGIADLNDATTTLVMPAGDVEITATYAEVADGLVSRFTFDVDARDTYGGNDGTLVNEAAVANDASRGNVLSLDGTDDYVSLPTDDLAAGRSELTLSVWVKPDSWSGGRTIYDEEAGWYWQFSITADAWYTRDSSTGTNGIRDNDVSMPTVPTGEWHHLAFVYSVTNDTKAIYYDGELHNSSSTSIDTLTSSRDHVAVGWPSDGNYFDGMIDDLRLYDRPLAKSEIALLAGGVTLYTLTVNSGTGDGDYVEDEVVNISADAAASGKQFEEWVGDTSHVADVDESSTTVTMPAGDVEVTATYVSVYTLTVNSGTGDGLYEASTVVNVSADTPASGKQFDEWVGDTAGVASVGSPNTTVTMPSSDVEITATYEDVTGGTTQLIVDWGDSESNNVYDFSDWGDPYLGLYTGYSSLGPDGIKAGWTGTAMSGAVHGSSETFSEGDQIQVTWYNSDTNQLTIYPKISFDDPDGYGSGTSGTWYDMGELVCSGESSETTTYTFTSGTAGDYSVVNVCRYTTGDVQPMIIDKVELITGGGGETYTLTVNSGTGDGDYAANAIVDITADAAPSGQSFDQWTGDISGIASVTSASTTITMPASDAQITATYTDVTYSLTVNSGSGDGSYAVNAVVDISADSPPSGTVFDKWTGQTQHVADVLDPTTTITMPAADTEVTATYVNVYTLTVNSGTGDGTYEQGMQVEIAADSPASGELFEEWTGDVAGIADVTDPTTTLTMPASDAEVTATYVSAYTLTVNSGSGDGVYKADEVVSIAADSAPAGMQFDKWTGDTSNIADVSAPSTTITMPASDADVTATYVNIYTLTVNSGSGGGVYTEGTVVDIDADPAPSGKVFDAWIGDTAGIADAGSADTTLTMPASDAEITATYQSIGGQYTLTVNSGSGDGDYDASEVVDISADAAASGELFDKWTGDVSGIADINDPTTTIVMPESDVEITASYTEVAAGLVSRYTFDVDARDTYGSNDGTLAGGAFIANDGTRGKVLSLDGTDDYVSLPTSNMTAGRSELTLTMWLKPDEWVASNTIWDEYAETNYWQFSITEGSWYTRDSSTGTTSPRNNDLSLPSVSTGAWHHLAFVYSVSGGNKAIYYDGALHASSGTSVDTLTSARDGAGVGYPSDGLYYDGMVDDVRLYDRALSGSEIALLAQQTTYTLTVNSGSGDGDYVAGAVVDISADAAASGQQFDDWIGDTGGIANVNSADTTLTMPAGDQEITATYSTASTYTLTVNSGSGDGTYTPGTVVDISADSPPGGKTFDVWVGDTSGIANVNAADTTLTMPSSNAEITATYADVGTGPSISSTSGTWSDGNSVTIYGSGFGSKSQAAPHIWDNFEGGSNGQSIDGKDPVIGPSWDTFTSHGYPPKYSNNGNRSNSTLCSRHDYVSGSQYNCSLEYYLVTSTVYFTYWWKYDLQSGVYNRNTKPWVEYGQDGGSWPAAYIGFGNPDYNDGGLRNSVQDQPHPTDGTLWGATSLTSVNHKWIRIEQYLEQSSPNVSNGTFMTWVQKPYNSPAVITFDLNSGENAYMTRTQSYQWRQWHFGSYFARDVAPSGGGGSSSGYIYLDDIYFDVTRARVELGNASTWAGCTQREIQIPSSWSSSSVTITVNQGAFSGFGGKYVYVVDSEGRVNSNGYACN